MRTGPSRPMQRHPRGPLREHDSSGTRAEEPLDAAELRALGLVHDQHVHLRQQRDRRLVRGGGVEDRARPRTPGGREGGSDCGERHLELSEHHSRPGDPGQGVLRSELAVRPRRHEDAVVAVVEGQHMRDPGRRGRGAAEHGVHARLRQRRLQHGPRLVRSDDTAEPRRGSRARRRDGLIEALATGEASPGTTEQRLSDAGWARDLDHEIEVRAPHDGDAGEGLRHGPSSAGTTSPRGTRRARASGCPSAVPAATAARTRAPRSPRAP